MPVAHAGPDHEVAVIAQHLFKGPRLFLGFFSYGGTTADLLIIGPAFRGAPVGNDPGNGFLQESRAQADDLPVRKQID